MGDHRFSFKAKFKMHDIEDELNLDWCNWSASDGGIDRRITEWIENVAKRAMVKYDEGVAAYYREQNKAELEKEERMQLALLKAKYELEGENRG